MTRRLLPLLELRVEPRWWWSTYVWLLAWASALSGREIDPDKFARMVERGHRYTLIERGGTPE